MRELILGGARSGKSTLAEARAGASGMAVTYIATAEAADAEMAARIAAHRERRPGGWHTVEAPLDLPAALADAAEPGRVVVIDCLTLWLANRLAKQGPDNDAALAGDRDALTDALQRAAGQVVVVSNEVSLGIVPDNAMARRFRDAAGRLNQAVAAACERVTFVAAGLPLTLKQPDA